MVRQRPDVALDRWEISADVTTSIGGEIWSIQDLRTRRLRRRTDLPAFPLPEGGYVTDYPLAL